MECQQAQDSLLRSEEPAPEVVAHLQTCSACGRLATQLSRLEQSWRAIPLPASATTANQAFLAQLQVTVRTRTRLFRPLRRRLLQGLVAACLFLGAGVAGWRLLDATRTAASAEVVDHLIDWNLELAQAPTTAECSRIYAERAEPLRRAVLKAKLPGEERELAENLLANGSWLAAHDDLMAEADRFTDVAELLLVRLDAASRRGSDKELHRLARQYARVAQHGIGAKLEKLQAAGALDGERERRLERVLQRDAHRRQKLEALLERGPEASRKEIKKALDVPRHAQKRKDTGTASAPQ